jgi:hypothetical protein
MRNPSTDGIFGTVFGARGEMLVGIGGYQLGG